PVSLKASRAHCTQGASALSGITRLQSTTCDPLGTFRREYRLDGRIIPSEILLPEMPRYCSLEPLNNNLCLPPWIRWQRPPSSFTIAAHGSKTCRRNKFWPNVFVNGNPEEISDPAHLTRQIGLQVIEVDEQNIRAASHHRRPGPGRGDLRLDV